MSMVNLRWCQKTGAKLAPHRGGAALERSDLQIQCYHAPNRTENGHFRCGLDWPPKPCDLAFPISMLGTSVFLLELLETIPPAEYAIELQYRLRLDCARVAFAQG